MNGLDIQYEVTRNPEPDDNAHQWLVEVYYDEPVIDDRTGRFMGMERVDVERFHCEDGPGFIAEMRYCEEVPLEERWAADAAREERERRGGY